MANDNPSSAPLGLHVVYGSRTRRGLNHANEDRHGVASWTEWSMDAHVLFAEVEEEKEVQSKDTTLKSECPKSPLPHVVTPLCTGSARRDTTLSGRGATGLVSESNPLFLSDGSPLNDEFTPPASNLQNANDLQKQRAFLWTVCDGHDGPEAADYVCKNIGKTFSNIWHSPASAKLPTHLLANRKFSSQEEGATYARGYALSNALARTFEALDSSFKVYADGGGPEGRGRPCTAGACVTSIFLVHNLMCCAGLGDCKAAILTLEGADKDIPGAADEAKGARATQQFQVTWFSKEHRSSAPKERTRIRARGGWFRHGRVGGVLEPTRTIGDFDVKASQPPGVVIATPEVRTFSVTKPALVLVASDGVWDVMDASQLLRTLKKRRRLWRGILAWLGAPLPERRGLMGFGFRRRAKSKEGLDAMLQVPTAGDLCAMADTLVTRAHDLGSDDDCTCVVIYLRPVASHKKDSSLTRPDATPEDLGGEPDMEIPPGPAEDDDDDDDDDDLEEELEEELEDDFASPPAADASYSEYEKWRNLPAETTLGADEEDDADADAVGTSGGDSTTDASKGHGAGTHGESSHADVWELSTAIFPVSLVPTAGGMDTLFPSSSVDCQDDAPEVIEKARKRREERRQARERKRQLVSARQQSKEPQALNPDQDSVPPI